MGGKEISWRVGGVSQYEVHFGDIICIIVEKLDVDSEMDM